MSTSFNGITISISGSNRGELLANMKALASAFEEETKTATAAKPATGKKNTKPAETEETEEEFSVDDAEETEEESTEDAAISLDDVIQAFQAYAKKNPANRAKALTLLKKYKVKNCSGLKESDYPAVMKAIGA